MAASPEKTPLSLLYKIQRGENAAWERLLSLYTPLVYYWCTVAKLQIADAEEVTQEVFLAVARGIGSFHRDQDGDTFRGWLRTITRTKIAEHWVRPAAKAREAAASSKCSSRCRHPLWMHPTTILRMWKKTSSTIARSNLWSPTLGRMSGGHFGCSSPEEKPAMWQLI